MIKPRYPSGPAAWESAAPKAQAQPQSRYQAPNSGSGRNYGGAWGGDRETSLPTVNALLSTGQQALTQYVVTRAALGPIEHDVDDIDSRLGAPRTGASSRDRLALGAGAMPMPGPKEPLALGAAPVPIPLGPGVDAGRPKFPAMGARGPREAPDARKAGGGALSYPDAIPVDPGSARRKGTGGNDRRLKGLIARQLNDRM